MWACPIGGSNGVEGTGLGTEIRDLDSNPSFVLLAMSLNRLLYLNHT